AERRDRRDHEAAAQVGTNQHGSSPPSIDPHAYEESEEKKRQGAGKSEEPHLERLGGENVDRDDGDCEAGELVSQPRDGLPKPQQEKVAVSPQGGRRGHDGQPAWSVPISTFAPSMSRRR